MNQLSVFTQQSGMETHINVHCLFFGSHLQYVQMELVHHTNIGLRVSVRVRRREHCSTDKHATKRMKWTLCGTWTTRPLTGAGNTPFTWRTLASYWSMCVHVSATPNKVCFCSLNTHFWATLVSCVCFRTTPFCWVIVTLSFKILFCPQECVWDMPLPVDWVRPSLSHTLYPVPSYSSTCTISFPSVTKSVFCAFWVFGLCIFLQ